MALEHIEAPPPFLPPPPGPGGGSPGLPQRRGAALCRPPSFSREAAGRAALRTGNGSERLGGGSGAPAPVRAHRRPPAPPTDRLTDRPTKFSRTELLPALCPPTTAICGRSRWQLCPMELKASCSLLTSGISSSMPRLPMATASAGLLPPADPSNSRQTSPQEQPPHPASATPAIRPAPRRAHCSMPLPLRPARPMRGARPSAAEAHGTC